MKANDSSELVVFVDMLGFKTLLERAEHVVPTLEPIFQPRTTTSAAFRTKPLGDGDELKARFTNFHRALEKRIRDRANVGVTAITFSDSAFVHFPTARTAIPFARGLMRDLITARVPVRMGIGSGTFAALRFFSDTTAAAKIQTTQFLGTAVVRAYEAERAGVEGLRILIHPKTLPIVKERNDERSWLGLEDQREAAAAEVNFLFSSGRTGMAAVHNRYDLMKDHLDQMRDEAPQNKRQYYTNTLSALRRMHNQLCKSNA